MKFFLHNLKPRILIYTLVALTTKALLLGFIWFFPLSAWLAPDVFEQENQYLVDLTNEVRTDVGLLPLSKNSSLTKAANLKLQDMLINQYFAHVSPADRKLENWLQMVNYQFLLAGENLAIGFSNLEDLITAWRQSPTHYANIINKSFSEIGVAVADGNFDGVNTTLAVQFFAKPNLTATTPKKIVKIVPAAISTSTSTSTKPQISGIQVGVGGKMAEAPTTVDFVDQTRSSMVVKKVSRQEVVIEARVYFLAAVQEVYLYFKEQRIDLYPSSEDSREWRAQKVIATPNNQGDLLVPPTLFFQSVDGSRQEASIKIENAPVAPASIFNKYFYIKDHPSFLGKVLALNSIYYLILLVLALIALGLNIFYRRQKKNRASLFALIGFILILVFLLIF